jgi:hypothetical protein
VVRSNSNQKQTNLLASGAIGPDIRTYLVSSQIWTMLEAVAKSWSDRWWSIALDGEEGQMIGVEWAT